MSNQSVDGSSVLNTNKIPKYAREYKNEFLFIRGINKTCGDFVKLLDEEGKIYNTPKSNKLLYFIKKFLKAQEKEYLNDISELYLKESDVNYIVSLELQLDDYMGIFYNPDSNKFDQEKYENDYPGLREFYESFSKFKNKIKIKEMTFSELKNSLIYLDSDSEDSESESDSDY